MQRNDVRTEQAKLAEDLKAYYDDRKPTIDRIQKEVSEVGPVEAASANDRLANAGLHTYGEGVFLERTHGNDDKAPINFLELGIRASRSVCRITDEYRTAIGTGFLIAPGLLITNNHVIPDEAAAQGMIAEFMYELDADELPLKPRRFLLEPHRLFMTSPESRLDFTIVAVAGVGLAGDDLALQSWIPMDERPNKILEGQPVVIVQHPDGQMKAICLFDSVLVLRDPDPLQPYILYTTDTTEGASGSPVFNRFWQLIGLHHASVNTGEIKNGEPVYINRGIRISSIFKALADGPAAGTLVGKAEHVTAVLNVLRSPAVRGNARPPATAAPLLPSSPAAERTSSPVIRERRGTVIRRKPADHLDGRTGYNPFFLSDQQAGAHDPADELHVPLPRLPDWLERDAARLTADDTKFELKYQHFSIVLSASRSLAIYTACNVDGSNMYKLDREDRDPDHFLDASVLPEAAADVWFYDPRVSESYQLGPELYDATSFDYGHLVRRLDPVWGDDARTPRIANDDTFFMTNCSPQETRFHRTRRGGDGNWSALEDIILNEANLKNKKFTIMTGPVLDPRDPAILGVKIPTAFWKIAAYQDAGRLKAHGFMLWQEQEVADVDTQFERRLTLADAKRPMRIREIARLTGLDFGPLFAADIRD